jgi:hypothetical protein
MRCYEPFFSRMRRLTPHPSSPPRGEETLGDTGFADFLSPLGERIKVRGNSGNSNTAPVTAN